MNKTLIVLFLVVFACFSMRINHYEGESAQAEAPADAPQPADPEAEEAFGRFFSFILADQDLSSTLFSGEQPNDDQIQRLMKFLVNDAYFQNQIIAQIEQDQDAQWFSGLSQEAKVRFLTIVSQTNPSDLENQESSNQLVQRLLDDQEIGAALRAQYGDNVSSEILRSAETAIASKASGAHHHLSKVAAHLFTV